MTTRREFFVLCGATLASASLASCINWPSEKNEDRINVLFLRDKSFPKSLFPHSRSLVNETEFSGDYASLVDLADRHFATGGHKIIAVIDTAGALLLAHTLRGKPRINITDQHLQTRTGRDNYRLVIAEICNGV